VYATQNFEKKLHVFSAILAGETGTAVWKIPEARGSKSSVLPLEKAASLSDVQQQWKWYVTLGCQNLEY